MELERTAAERRLNSLSKETTQYRDVLNQKQTQSIETTAELSQRTQGERNKGGTFFFFLLSFVVSIYANLRQPLGSRLWFALSSHLKD